MTDKQWIVLLVIIAVVYYLLTRPQTYPAFLPKPSPKLQPKPELERLIALKNIHVTFIHPNGSSTSTYFPVEVWNSEYTVTVDAQRLGYTAPTFKNL